MATNLVNKLMVRVVERLVNYAETEILGRKPGLYSEVDNPELIQAVTKELQKQDAKFILDKLTDLEKAIYHVAGKQQDMIMHQKDLEKVIVGTATTLEMMTNGIENAIDHDHADSQEEEEFLVDAWGSNKKTATSSRN